MADEAEPIKDEMHSDSIADHIQCMLENRASISAFDHTYQLMTKAGMSDLRVRVFLTNHYGLARHIDKCVRVAVAKLQRGESLDD